MRGEKGRTRKGEGRGLEQKRGKERKRGRGKREGRGEGRRNEQSIEEVRFNTREINITLQLRDAIDVFENIGNMIPILHQEKIREIKNKEFYG